MLFLVLLTYVMVNQRMKLQATLITCWKLLSAIHLCYMYGLINLH
jgi:hypothetical protein